MHARTHAVRCRCGGTERQVCDQSCTGRFEVTTPLHGRPAFPGAGPCLASSHPMKRCSPGLMSGLYTFHAFGRPFATVTAGDKLRAARLLHCGRAARTASLEITQSLASARGKAQQRCSLSGHSGDQRLLACLRRRALRASSEFPSLEGSWGLDGVATGTVVPSLRATVAAQPL